MNPIIIRPDPAAEFRTSERCSILESWNKDEDPAVSIARATVKPGVTTQLHRLLNVGERYIIVSGTGSVKIDSQRLKEVVPGDIVVIRAGVPQQITNTGAVDLVFYCICSPRFTQECYQSLE